MAVGVGQRRESKGCSPCWRRCVQFSPECVHFSGQCVQFPPLFRLRCVHFPGRCVQSELTTPPHRRPQRGGSWAVLASRSGDLSAQAVGGGLNSGHGAALNAMACSVEAGDEAARVPSRAGDGQTPSHAARMISSGLRSSVGGKDAPEVSEICDRRFKHFDFGDVTDGQGQTGAGIASEQSRRCGRACDGAPTAWPRLSPLT